MEEKKTQKILGHVILPSGKKVEVLSKGEKYYICKNCQFRKSTSVFVPAEKKEVKKKDA